MRGYCAYTATEPYNRLQRVMAASWHAHHAGCPLTVQRYTYTAADARGPDDVTGAFLIQLRMAAEEVAKSCEPLILLDADLLIRAPLDDVWDTDFDIAITVRDDPQRYNAGVVFARPTPDAAGFFAKWSLAAQAFCAAADSGESQRKRWGSVDQAALAWLLERGTHAEVAELPCGVWNACEQHWVSAHEPKILHVKGMLRKHCLNGETTAMGLGGFVREWMMYDQEYGHE